MCDEATKPLCDVSLQFLVVGMPMYKAAALFVGKGDEEVLEPHTFYSLDFVEFCSQLA